jgi:hypothetical protein
MPQNTWHASYGPLEIVFENHWTFSCETRETLIVNGEVVSERKKDKSTNFKELTTGFHRVLVDSGGEPYEVVVKVGTKWHLLSMGCHIFVNGNLIGGDTKSKLLFLAPRSEK